MQKKAFQMLKDHRGSNNVEIDAELRESWMDRKIITGLQWRESILGESPLVHKKTKRANRKSLKEMPIAPHHCYWNIKMSWIQGVSFYLKLEAKVAAFSQQIQGMFRWTWN